MVSFVRRGDGEELLVVLNFTPVTRPDYRIGAPRPGEYKEILNSDSEIYAGSNAGNLGSIHTQNTPMHNQPQSLELTIPPLAGLILK